MAISTKEALAAIRLLVCMAKADGVLKPEERTALEDALSALPLPGGLTVVSLLAETNDPRALTAEITSEEGRDYAYAAALALASCDREVADAEEALLQIMRNAWGIDKAEDVALLAALTQAHQPEPSSAFLQAAVADETQREQAFHRLLTRYCVLTAVTGAIPVPLIPDLLVIPMQVTLVYRVAGLFGLRTDKGTIQLLFETLGVGTGVRLGVSALSKLVPGWGSVVGGASAYATTYALGKVAWKYYEDGGTQPLESLKPVFQQAQVEGKEEFAKHKASLDEAQKAHGAELKQLAFELQQGKLTQQEYEKRVDALG